MREFEKFEMFKMKCPVCGCKNKLHTELMDKYNRFLGYTLKCCNCGNTYTFLLDAYNNGQEKPVPVKTGKERCIQLTYCNRKGICPLYGTCTVEINDVDFKPAKKPLPGTGGQGNCNMHCSRCPHRKTCTNFCANHQTSVSMSVFTPPKFL